MLRLGLGLRLAMRRAGGSAGPVQLPLTLGDELRPDGEIAEIGDGSATNATYNTGSGVGTASRSTLANQSSVQWTGLPFASFRLNITIASGTMLVRTGAILQATLTAGTHEVDIGSTGDFSLLSSANGTTVSFTVNSLKQILQSPQSSTDWARDTFYLDDEPAVQRTVSYKQPSTGSGPWPVVLFLHGGSGHGEITVDPDTGTDFETICETNGWLLIAAQGEGGRFAYGTEPPDDLSTAANITPRMDAAYLDEVLRRVALSYSIDAENIWAVGVSMGGMMAHYHAAVGTRKPTAMALVAATKQTLSTSPGPGIPLLHIHGEDDESLPLLGGDGVDTAAGYDPRPVQTGIDEWLAEGNAATLIVLAGGVHDWQPTIGYDTNGDIEAFLLAALAGAPDLTNPDLDGQDLAFDSDEAGVAYYTFEAAGATSPIAGATIKTDALAATPDQVEAMVAGANQFTPSGIPTTPGTYRPHVVGEDALGNLGAFSIVLPEFVVADVTAPVLTGFALTEDEPPRLAATTDEACDLYYAWTTSVTEIGAATIETDALAATPDQTLAYELGANEDDLEGVPTEDGSHYLHAFPKDAAGNSGVEYVSAAYVIADTVAPTLSSPDVDGEDFSVLSDEAGLVYYTWEAGDTPIAGTTIKTDALAADPDQVETVVADENVFTPTGVPTTPGTYYLHMVGEDSLGNLGASSTVFPAYVVPAGGPTFVQSAGVGPSSASAGTAHSIDLVSGITDGNQLILVIALGAGTITVAPSGWTPVTDFAEAVAGRAYVYKKTASSDSGATVTWTTSTNTVCAGTFYEIDAPNNSVEATTTTAIDPPAINPAAGSNEYLFIAVAIMQRSTGSFTAAPSGYGGLINGFSSSPGTSGGGERKVGSAYLIATAASEDPGVFTGSAHTAEGSLTIAVR